MTKYIISVVLLFSLCNNTSGQKIYEEYTKSKDSLRIGNGIKDYLPYNEAGYTVILPDSITKLQGVLVSLEDQKFDLKANTKQQIYSQATAKQFAVLYVSSGVPADLFFAAKTLQSVDKIMATAFKRFKLPTYNVFFLGVSLAGHRALKYTQYCKQGKSNAGLSIKGVVLCDSVLDWVRQWYEEKKGVKDNFAPSAVSEGKLVTYLLEKNLNGTPKNNIEAYLKFSTYSYFDETNRNVKYFKDLSIRTYTEPATYYWMNERRKGVFDTNFPDMVGIINELKLLGNKTNELIVFHQDKENNDRRNPYYTWELVDKEELLNWIGVEYQ